MLNRFFGFPCGNECKSSIKVGDLYFILFCNLCSTYYVKLSKSINMNKINNYIQIIGGLVTVITLLSIAVFLMCAIWGKIEVFFVKVIFTELVIYVLLRVADYFTKD